MAKKLKHIEEFDFRGDVIKLINNKIYGNDVVNLKEENIKNGKKYTRIYKTDVIVPDALKALSSICQIQVKEEIIVTDIEITCNIKSPESIKGMFTFDETMTFKPKIGEDTIKCIFSSDGKVLSVAIPFTDMIWNLYKKRRIEKIHGELQKSLFDGEWDN